MRKTTLGLLALTLLCGGTFSGQTIACDGGAGYSCHAPRPVLHQAYKTQWKRVYTYEYVTAYDYYGRLVRRKQLVEKLVPIAVEHPRLATAAPAPPQPPLARTQQTKPAIRPQIRSNNVPQQAATPVATRAPAQASVPVKPAIQPQQSRSQRLPKKAAPKSQSSVETQGQPRLPRGSNVTSLAPKKPEKQNKAPAVRNPAADDQPVLAPLATDFVD